MSKYRIVATDKVHFTDNVFGGKEGITFLNDGKPVTILKDDLVAVLETAERDVTASFVRSYGEDY